MFREMDLLAQVVILFYWNYGRLITTCTEDLVPTTLSSRMYGHLGSVNCQSYLGV